MTDFDQFERRLATSLRTDADQSVDPYEAGQVARAAIAGTRPTRRFGRGRGITLLAAAAVLLVGGALAAGSGFLRLPTVVPPVPEPSVVAVATASPDATSTPMPTLTAPPSPPPTPSLDLTWTQVPIGEQFAPWSNPKLSPRLAWIGDRFVLADVTSGAVMTSTDGQDWQALQDEDAARSYVDLLRGSFASWQDIAFGWWNPQDREGGDSTGAPPITARDIVQVVHPPAAPTSTTPFEGRIASIGIGPKGIVAEVHSPIKVSAPGRNRGFGWYSPDGEHWTAMEPNDHPTWHDGWSLPTGGVGSVPGVSDGFIATAANPEGTCDDLTNAPDGSASCEGIWYSSDGLTWRLLGITNEIAGTRGTLCVGDGCGSRSGALLPWQGGALAIDLNGRIDLWTSGGSTELPFAAQGGTTATGPLGIVSFGDGQAVVSRDGIDHKVSSIPAQISQDAQWGKSGVAVGDGTIVVLGSENSLWLGRFEP